MQEERAGNADSHFPSMSSAGNADALDGTSAASLAWKVYLCIRDSLHQSVPNLDGAVPGVGASVQCGAHNAAEASGSDAPGFPSQIKAPNGPGNTKESAASPDGSGAPNVIGDAVDSAAPRQKYTDPPKRMSPTLWTPHESARHWALRKETKRGVSNDWVKCLRLDATMEPSLLGSKTAAQCASHYNHIRIVRRKERQERRERKKRRRESKEHDNLAGSDPEDGEDDCAHGEGGNHANGMKPKRTKNENHQEAESISSETAASCYVVLRTRTRTNTNPNGTEANAAGRSVRACDARRSTDI